MVREGERRERGRVARRERDGERESGERGKGRGEMGEKD